MTGTPFELLVEACELANVPLHEPALLRDGENVVWKANAATIVRIGRTGQTPAVKREVNIASWLAGHDFPAARLIGEIRQPLEIRGRPVTFWAKIDQQRSGTVREVAGLLRHLHDLPQPVGFDPGRLEPFVRLSERISGSSTITEADNAWLVDRLGDLELRWVDLPAGLQECVVHGDAWIGNVAVDASGHALMLDLERAAVGPPEWDLVSTAIKVSSFGWVTPKEYQEFVEIYGSDVTGWAGFELLRDIRELRMTTYLVQKAAVDPNLVTAAQFRVDCLRGRHGPRPWPWTSSG